MPSPSFRSSYQPASTDSSDSSSSAGNYDDVDASAWHPPPRPPPRHQSPIYVTRRLAGPAKLVQLGLADPHADFLFLRNACVWTPGQLEGELAQGAWIPVRHADVAGLIKAQARYKGPADSDANGQTPPSPSSSAPSCEGGAAAAEFPGGEAMWTRLMASLGGDYAAALAACPPGLLGRLPRDPAEML